MGRGSLVHSWLTWAQFMAVYSWPITPAEAPEPATAEAGHPQHKRRRGCMAETRSAGKHFRHFVRKAVGLAAVVSLYLRLPAKGVPRPLLVVLQGLSQYLGLSMGMDFLAALVSASTGLAVAPHFDNPYLSTSVADFWNRRWNLAVSNLFRAAVYEPNMSGRLVHRPGQAAAPYSPVRRMVAVLAVFVVSGAMHELMFWFFSCRLTPHLMWFWYFVLWGVILVAENLGKKVFRSAGLKMPTILARILTLFLVNVLVAALWWPPVEQLGVPQKAARHAADTWRSLQQALLGNRRAGWVVT